MEEYKIGEVFQFGKIKLKCVKGDNETCTGCIFSKLSVCEYSELVPFLGECIGTERKDKTGVIFIEA